MVPATHVQCASASPRPVGPTRPMDSYRPPIANGSLMAAGGALLWAATVWCVALNAPVLYGAPAGARLGDVVSAATWLALPALLSAAPAWFLSRALARLGIARRGSRMVRWFVFAWRMNLGALVIELFVLGWHASAGSEAPAIDLPIHVLGLWLLAFVNYVPALMAWQARQREREEGESGESGAMSDGRAPRNEGREEF